MCPIYFCKRKGPTLIYTRMKKKNCNCSKLGVVLENIVQQKSFVVSYIKSSHDHILLQIMVNIVAKTLHYTNIIDNLDWKIVLLYMKTLEYVIWLSQVGDPTILYRIILKLRDDRSLCHSIGVLLNFLLIHIVSYESCFYVRIHKLFYQCWKVIPLN